MIFVRFKGRVHLSQEPCDQIAEDDGLVRLVVARWRRNAGNGPEVALPLVEELVSSAGVEEQDSRGAINQPATIECLNAAVVHVLYSLG